MMKRIILFLLVAFSGSMLYAQDVIEGKKSGDVLKGEKAAYQLDSCKNCWKLYNVKNQVAKGEEFPEGWLGYPFSRYPTPKNVHIDYLYNLPKVTKEKFIKILCCQLSPKELKLMKRDSDWDLIIRCYLTLEGRVEEVSFNVSGESTKQAIFWRNFSMDRFYRLEQEIIREIDEGTQEWFLKEKEWRRQWAEKHGKDIERTYIDVDPSYVLRSLPPFSKRKSR